MSDSYDNLAKAIVRQACIDYRDASRRLCRMTSIETNELLARYRNGEFGHDSTEDKKMTRKVSKIILAQGRMKEISKFLMSDWARTLMGDEAGGERMLATLRYRDWRSQLTRDGFTIPRGEEFVVKDFMTPEEKKKHKSESGFYSHKNTEEIGIWFNDLSDDEKKYMRTTRNYDADEVYKVLGVRL